MSEIREIHVPDIGDFKDLPVIEVLVKPGDTVAIDEPLLTLESDKASMDVPSSEAGVVVAVTVKEGDRVSRGSLMLTLQVAVSAEPAPQPAVSSPAQISVAPVAVTAPSAPAAVPAVNPSAAK
ncbi:branched-chain alpha-keto acid dehydrogenase subunit E2, partial [Pseudomonas sp. FSL R10-0765]